MAFSGRSGPWLHLNNPDETPKPKWGSGVFLLMQTESIRQPSGVLLA